MGQVNVNTPGEPPERTGTGAGFILGLIVAIVIIALLIYFLLLNGGGGGTPAPGNTTGPAPSALLLRFFA